VESIPFPERIIYSTDHFTYDTVSPSSAELHKSARQWTEKYGITHTIDIGRGGLRHQEPLERGWILPGMLVFSEEPDLSNMGAIGAVNFGTFEKDLFEVMILGETWIEVPNSVNIILKGQLSRGVMARDLAQTVAATLGTNGAVGQALEFNGPGIIELSIDGRMNLLAYTSVTGGVDLTVMNPDDLALDWVRAHSNNEFQEIYSDPDATYIKELEFDLSNIVPQVALPPVPENSVPIDEMVGTSIHFAGIGSCCGGRLEDLQVAAQIMKGKKIHPNVRMFVTPISKETWAHAETQGLLRIFDEAGAMVCTSTCGVCYGYFGQLAENEVSLTTNTLNYPGRQGSPKATINLASAATVAASAITGEIVDPRDFI
jgi:3-isopropylmalate/(R)-2-methylmalate dehydratase large subunit